jgi:hypothetical protein
VSTPSSRPPRPHVNVRPDLMSVRQRALDPGNARKLFKRRVLECERRIRSPLIAREKTVPKPEMADDVLAGIARHFAPGTQLGVRQIAEATGFSMARILTVRRWAQAVGLWAWSERPTRPGGGT